MTTSKEKQLLFNGDKIVCIWNNGDSTYSLAHCTVPHVGFRQGSFTSYQEAESFAIKNYPNTDIWKEESRGKYSKIKKELKP